MSEHQVLFCPFCRESFERESRCPEHELPLVSFTELTPDASLSAEDDDELEPAPKLAPDDRLLGALDPRHGRGVVAAGALLNAAALGLPLFGGEHAASLLSLARAVPSLWTVLLVSFTVLFSLARRRTLRRLRGLRVLVPLLALLSPLTLAWAALRWTGLQGSAHRSLGAAVYVVVGASVLLVLGGLRLGQSARAPSE